LADGQSVTIGQKLFKVISNLKKNRIFSKIYKAVSIKFETRNLRNVLKKFETSFTQKYFRFVSKISSFAHHYSIQFTYRLDLLL
jgi:hypothetical protein